MTKIKNSGIGIVAMSGSSGSDTITRNAFGWYQKSRLGAPAVISPSLASWQAQVSAVTAVWQILTDDQRTSWIIASKSNYWARTALQEKRRFTGFTLFMYINLNRILTGLATLVSPPVYEGPSVITNVTVTLLPGPSIDVSVDATKNARFAFYSSYYLPPGRMSSNQLFKFLAFQAPGSLPFSFDIIGVLVGTLGLWVPGQKIFIRVDPITDSGRRGSPYIVPFILP